MKASKTLLVYAIGATFALAVSQSLLYRQAQTIKQTRKQSAVWQATVKQWQTNSAMWRAVAKQKGK